MVSASQRSVRLSLVPKTTICFHLLHSQRVKFAPPMKSLSIRSQNEHQLAIGEALEAFCVVHRRGKTLSGSVEESFLQFQSDFRDHPSFEFLRDTKQVLVASLLKLCP